MRGIRYLSVLVLMLCSALAWAQDDFNPTNPAEPGAPPCKLILNVEPAEGGSVSGAGKYVSGTNVSLRAYNSTNFVFEKWVDANGETISTSSSFQYTKNEGDEVLTAIFQFSPGNPAEPTETSKIQYFRLNVVAEEGGSVSGGGKYLSYKKVTIGANVNTGFEFVCWTNTSGDTVSVSRSFTYTTTPKNETLTAHFRFNPGSPNEPSVPVFVKSHNITVSATDGGTVSVGNNKLKEGESTTLRATPNTGYQFMGWYVCDTLYTSLSSFSYTMGDTDIDFRALFEFNPTSPGEPAMPSDKKYSFYQMTIVGVPGDTIDYPLYLTSLDTLCDMTFQLTFPSGLTPESDTVALSSKAEGYDISFTTESDTTYVFSMIGGKVPPGNTLLLQFRVAIPETYETGTVNKVKINQVSVTEVDGTHLTASTLNGNIAIYKRGDTNGDNEVDVSDVMNLANYVLKKETEVFINEVSDVTEDNEIDVADAMGIVNIVLKKE